MSTKIYYGLKVAKGAPHLLEMGGALQSVMKPVFAKRLNLLLTLEWTEEMKRLKETGEDEDISYYKLLINIDQKIDAAAKSLQRDYIYGTDFSLTFLQGTSRRMLALPAFQIQEYYSALLETGWFEEYGYWDNTDKPEGISVRAWTARGKEWGKAMGENWRAIDRGLTWEYKPQLLLDFPLAKVDWEDLKALSEKPDSPFVQWCDEYKEKSKKDPWSA